LSEKKPLELYVQQIEEVENLDILTAGSLPPSPTKLLGSKALEALITDARKVYDIIIIDVPPILHVTDAARLSRFVDGAVLIVSVETTKKAALIQCRKALEKVNANILGVILIKVKIKKGNPYYYYYSGYYNVDEDGTKSKRRKKTVKQKNRLQKGNSVIMTELPFFFSYSYSIIVERGADMIETHSHCIAMVDDGPKTLEMSLKMLHMAKLDGVTEIIATPHYRMGRYENEQVGIEFEKLTLEAQKAGLEIVLHLGNEIYLDEESIKPLIENQANKPYTMAGSRYVLIELPFMKLYPIHEDMLYRIQLAGYQIILAHIERYPYFISHSELLESLIKRGLYGQITGRWIIDKKTRKLAIKWIKQGYVQLVATDAHDADTRPTHMTEAYDIIKRYLSEEVAKTLCIENPKRIINDQIRLKEWQISSLI
jgi:protein-tyrosine phosphatase